MHVIIIKGDWSFQENCVGDGPDSIKAAVATIVRMHPSIIGDTTTVAVHGDDGAEPSVYPLSQFIEGGFSASESAVIEEPTPLHQETGEAGA